MEVRAVVRLFASWILWNTTFCAICARVIIKFFPSMTFITLISLRASIFIMSYFILWRPMGTSDRIIKELIRWSPVILIVMSIHTFISLMILFSKWTKYCFIFENIEFIILGIVVNQFNSDISLTMSKRTVFFEFAPLHFLRKS